MDIGSTYLMATIRVPIRVQDNGEFEMMGEPIIKFAPHKIAKPAAVANRDPRTDSSQINEFPIEKSEVEHILASNIKKRPKLATYGSNRTLRVYPSRRNRFSCRTLEYV